MHTRIWGLGGRAMSLRLTLARASHTHTHAHGALARQGAHGCGVVVVMSCLWPWARVPVRPCAACWPGLGVGLVVFCCVCPSVPKVNRRSGGNKSYGCTVAHNSRPARPCPPVRKGPVATVTCLVDRNMGKFARAKLDTLVTQPLGRDSGCCYFHPARERGRGRVTRKKGMGRSQ